MFERITACRSCAGTDLQTVLDLGEIDQFHLEATVLDGTLTEPLGDGQADPSRTGARDDDLQYRLVHRHSYRT